MPDKERHCFYWSFNTPGYIHNTSADNKPRLSRRCLFISLEENCLSQTPLSSLPVSSPARVRAFARAEVIKPLEVLL